MSASTFLKGKVIDSLLRTASAYKPAHIYVGILTTMPSDASGTGMVEVSGGAYARVQCDPSDSNWSSVGANVNAIIFPTPTANWGASMPGFALFDAATSGNLVAYGTFTAPKTVNNGDSAPSFAIGALVITVS